MTNSNRLLEYPSPSTTTDGYYSSPSSLLETRAAMSSSPRIDQHGNVSGGSGYGSNNSDNGKSPLYMSLGFLKTLTEKKGTRVDGQPLKKRGPKPDSKPALTRRQELNRQAQRTHRERKELYIKALEQEVIRLKETFTAATQDKQNLANENQQLKQLLAQHGIAWHGTGGVDELAQNPKAGYASSGSISGSYGPGSHTFSPPSTNALSLGGSQSPSYSGPSFAQQQQPGIDYDQAGIDFVLTLERPCMDHMQFLCERAGEPEGEPCGHALMATCPPDAYLDNSVEIPFGHSIGTTVSGQKTWDLSKGALANLLDLSKRIDLDGEITPVMAWGMVLNHERFSELTLEDFARLTDDLKTKVRCYGFGAVLEEFEVRDALMKMFYVKPESNFIPTKFNTKPEISMAQNEHNAGPEVGTAQSNFNPEADFNVVQNQFNSTIPGVANMNQNELKPEIINGFF